MPSSAPAVAALLAAVTTVAGSLAVAPAQATAPPAPARAQADGVTMVHANIKSALTPARFQADVAKVLADGPDFVTYNEVPERLDSVLAPQGYQVYRLKRNRYTKANAVAWRTDRWTAIDSGTSRVSNYRKIPRGRRVKLGLRFANWVTLQGPDGRELSVVATHVAPPDRNMPDLVRPSVKRIGTLTGQLAARGPVLVGGDFNVHYRSGRFPRDIVDAAAMVPTYDTLSSYFPTGDHHGATIDYVFNRGDLLLASKHHPMELHSDHDAVVADLTWTADPAGSAEHVVTDPASKDRRRLVVDAMLAEIRALAPGDRAALVTADLSLGAVRRQLGRAVRRGVELSLITRSRSFTRAERRLARLARRAGGGRSEVVSCSGGCLERWREADLAPTFLLVRDTSGPVLRVDASRTLSARMLQRRTHLHRLTGSVALAEGEDMLAAVR